MNPKPLLKSKTALLGLITTIAGLVGASSPEAGAWIAANANWLLGTLGIISIILRRITHGRVVLIPDQPDDARQFRGRNDFFSIGPFLLLACAVSLTACNGTGGGIGGVSVSLGADGVCAASEDGRYRVCWNPLTHGFTLKSAVPGNHIVADLTYDTAAHRWTAALPDGSQAVYSSAGLHIEPPLPK